MIRKAMLPFVLAALAMLVVAGCSSEKEQVDPYATVSLHQAVYGPSVISKGWRYKLVNPEIVEAEGHLLFIREGNVTQIIAGRSIADKIENLDQSNIIFNVVKKYSPYVHFKCEQVVSGEDSVFISSAGSIYYPRIIEASEFRSKDHDEYSMDNFKYNDTAGLRRLEERKFALTGQLAIVEEDGDEVWMLTGSRASLRIEDPDDVTLMVLRMLLADNMEFKGGITFITMEEWTERRDNQVAGTIEIDFVEYMGKVFTI